MSEPTKPNYQRVTSMFKSEKGGLFGAASGDYLDRLIVSIKEVLADKENKQLGIFLKVWKEGENPVLTVASIDKKEQEKPQPKAPEITF